MFMISPPPPTNYCLNVSSSKHPSLYHKRSLWGTIKEAKRGHLFSVEFLSGTQSALLAGGGSGELPRAQVMKEWSDWMETESLPRGLVLRLLQKERQEDDRSTGSEFL